MRFIDFFHPQSLQLVVRDIAQESNIGSIHKIPTITKFPRKVQSLPTKVKYGLSLFIFYSFGHILFEHIKE